jgi:hypothetical protein
VSYQEYEKTVYHKPNQEVIEEAQRKYYASLVPKGTSYACNCVLWAQANGLPISGYGAAKNYPVTSNIPSISGFVVTYEGAYGHMARYVLDGEWLVLTEANYRRCRITTGRRLHISSPVIKGYI